MITPDLIRGIRQGYRLPWRGIHGVAHWARGLENGLRLAPLTGARPDVVRLFAVFHDARRRNDHWDPGHGRRGAELAASLRGRLFHLPDEDFALLFEACELLADGLTEGDLTVQTCWDADRLDLGRVGISPHPDRLGTEAARSREILSWADGRGTMDHVPAIVSAEWDIA